MVDESKHVFVECRQNTTFVANEMVDANVKNRKEGLLCKLDVEKVYDNISWSKDGFGALDENVYFYYLLHSLCKRWAIIVLFILQRSR